MLILHTTSPAASENTHSANAPRLPPPAVWKVGHGRLGGTGPGPRCCPSQLCSSGHHESSRGPRGTVDGDRAQQAAHPPPRVPAGSKRQGLTEAPLRSAAPPDARLPTHRRKPRLGLAPEAKAGCQAAHTHRLHGRPARRHQQYWGGGARRPSCVLKSPPGTSEMRRISENKPMGSITHKNHHNKKTL